MTPALTFALFALFGLIFGSFGNVVIWRLPRNESLSFPGSHCTVCNHPLAPTDNIPLLSYLALRGKCRYCNAPISVRYPIIEALSAVLWGIATLIASNYVEALIFALFFYLLLLLAVIDIDTRRLPNKLVAFLALIGCAGVALSYVSLPATLAFPWKESAEFTRVMLPLALTSDQSPALLGALGVVASALPALLLALVYQAVRHKQGFGMGDIKLLAAIGPFLGLYGGLVLPIAALIGLFALFGARLANKSVSIQTQIPFGPFISIAAVGILIFGPAFWTWYTQLLI